MKKLTTVTYAIITLNLNFLRVHSAHFNSISFSFCSYGLLGASGCGKTTVLSTIVGLKKVDKGIVSIYGAMPGDRKMGIPGKRVGYMPQVK